MCSLFYREIQQFTENNPYKISASNGMGAGYSLPSMYYELLIEIIPNINKVAFSQKSVKMW